MCACAQRSNEVGLAGAGLTMKQQDSCLRCDDDVRVPVSMVQKVDRTCGEPCDGLQERQPGRPAKRHLPT